MKSICRAVLVGVVLVGGATASAESRRTSPAAKARPAAKAAKAPLVASRVDAKPAPQLAGDVKLDAKSDAAATPAVAVDANAERAVALDNGAEAALDNGDQKAEAMIVAAPPLPKVTAATAPTAKALMVNYQRVGRDIMQLQQLRGTECTLELKKLFGSIKVDEAVATPEARAAAAATLTEIQSRIARKRGITISQQCLDNPLAPDCL